MVFAYPFVIEALDLLAENEVLKQCWTPLSDLQAFLVSDGTADVRGHEGILIIQIELRQELLGRGCGAAIVTTLVGVR